MTKSSDQQRKLLMVEDDPGLQRQLKWSLEGFSVIVANDRESALTELRRHEPPVVTLDLGLPPDPANASEGLRALQEILGLMPQAKVIVVTGNDDRSNAVRAVAQGAYDFYQKPVDAEILRLIVERAYHLYDLEQENRLLGAHPLESPLHGIIASSPEMLEVCRKVEKVGPTDLTVLLLGESGTGKELLARALHALSLRKDGKFVAINCAAIPETLLESELFGYEKGAFTGADKQTLGKIEYANGGTLFLDEVGDLPKGLQAKLLRFLQERVIERVGGRREIEVDLRVVCATHKDLKQMITSGDFREDLFYRISELAIEIPPLRARTGDALVLARSFLQSYAQQCGKQLNDFSDDALKAIDHYPWPGNARELENKVKRAVIMGEKGLVTAQDLELAIDDEAAMPLNLKQVREQAEREAIQRALKLANGRIAQAAELLGVSRPTLYDFISRYGINSNSN